MLHVFHLNVGRQLNLDVSYSAQPVDRLQEEVERRTNIPKSDQILLISGGIVLSPGKCLSSYTSAGSESNPIFLVSRLKASEHREKHQKCEEEFQPMTQLTLDLEKDLSNLTRQPFSVENAAIFPQLAEKVEAASQRLADVCLQLVAEQHNIYQGWCSVVANLDDTIGAFHRHIRKFCRKRDWLAQSRQAIEEMLEKLPHYLELIKRLPLVRPLVEANPLAESRCRAASGDSSSSDGSSSNTPAPSLLSWISGTDEEMDVNELGSKIATDLNVVLENSVLVTFEQCEDFTASRLRDVQMKEIRGITQRFTQLNNYVQKMSRLKVDQSHFAECVCMHQQKLSDCGDRAVQNDIYAGMGCFLVEMVKNQKWMLDVAKRFGLAKLELLENIRRRLEWVISTHEYIHAADTEVFVQRERVAVLIRRLELMKQLRVAPYLYAQAVAEIKRRQALRRQFMEWAKQVSARSSRLFVDETKHRKALSARLDSHFLGSLFQCLEKTFPAFALEPPEPFDCNLPCIEYEHLEQIYLAMPELSSCLRLSHGIHSLAESSSPSKADVRTPRVSFYSSTPPGEEQRMSSGSPCFFHSTENLPFCGSSSFGSLSYKTNSDVDLSANEQVKAVEETDSPADTSSTFQRSAPISIPSVRQSSQSLFPRLPSSMSSCGSGSLPQAERFFGTQQYDVLFDGSDSVGRSFDLHPLSPDFISVSPFPGELHESLLPPVDSAKASDSVLLSKQAHLLQELSGTTAELVKAKEEIVSMQTRLDRWATTGSQLKDLLCSCRKHMGDELSDLALSLHSMSDLLAQNVTRAQSKLVESAQKHDAAVTSTERIKEPSTFRPAISSASCYYVSKSDCHLHECGLDVDNDRRMAQSDQAQMVLFKNSRLTLDAPKDDVQPHTSPPVDGQFCIEDVDSLRQLYLVKLAELKDLSERLKPFPFHRMATPPFALSTSGSGTFSPDNVHETELFSPGMPTFLDEADLRSIVKCCVDTLIENVSADSSHKSASVMSVGCTQTDIDYRISVVTIEPGDVVLVIYEPTMETFVLFCLPKVYYVLTESSVRRLGLSRDTATDQCKWTFGRVTKKQLCQTKKSSNRYNLPVGAKFYRVSVEPIAGAIAS
ncbi:hypothetical protein M514_00532 [Trichuris suis]|uniref:Autophagy-related protein 11 C-terminal domain-containing protein n=1 Tax=Trichuris suis TaxID=68888 RepID=A0A085NDD9_9BILA|nr:hypothetical protein M514_00532 [Trichuris suis]